MVIISSARLVRQVMSSSKHRYIKQTTNSYMCIYNSLSLSI